MEALIALLCDILALVFTSLVPAIIALFTVLLALLPLLIETGVFLVIAPVAWWRRLRPAAPAGDPAAPAAAAAAAPAAGLRGHPWWRRLVFASAILATAGIIGLALLATVFADDLLSWGIARATRGTGITVTHASSTSALLSGTAVLHDVHVTTATGAATRAGLESCDLAIGDVAVQVSVTALLHGELQIDSATLLLVRGNAVIGRDHALDASGSAAPHATGPGATAGPVPAAATPAIPADPAAAEPEGQTPTTPTRPWSLAHLEITDLDLDVTLHRHGSTLRGPLTIASWVTAPVDRDHALLDLLLSTNAQGTVLGAPFAIANDAVGAPGKTTWRLTGVPAPLLAATFAGPFDWLEDGRIDVAVDNTLSIETPPHLRMDWQLKGSGLTLVDAGRFDPLQAKLIGLLAAYLARYHGNLDLGFQVDADPDHFTGALSFDAAGLSALMSPLIVQELSKRLGLNPDQVRAADGLIRDLGKAAWDHWRKRHPAPASPAPDSATTASPMPAPATAPTSTP